MKCVYLRALGFLLVFTWLSITVCTRYLVALFAFYNSQLVEQPSLSCESKQQISDKWLICNHNKITLGRKTLRIFLSISLVIYSPSTFDRELPVQLSCYTLMGHILMIAMLSICCFICKFLVSKSPEVIHKYCYVLLLLLFIIWQYINKYIWQIYLIHSME